jgi:hypothetical protein
MEDQNFKALEAHSKLQLLKNKVWKQENSDIYPPKAREELRTGRVVQVVELLPRKCEALSSNQYHYKRERERERERRIEQIK